MSSTAAALSRPLSTTSAERCASGGDRRTVQFLLELLLGLLGQRRLQHGPTELTKCVNRLVGGDLLDHEEECRGAGLEHLSHLVLEVLVDACLGDLAHERAHTRADGHAEYGDEEQQADQQTPEHPPSSAAAH